MGQRNGRTLGSTESSRCRCLETPAERNTCSNHATSVCSCMTQNTACAGSDKQKVAQYKQCLLGEPWNALQRDIKPSLQDMLVWSHPCFWNDADQSSGGHVKGMQLTSMQSHSTLSSKSD